MTAAPPPLDPPHTQTSKGQGGPACRWRPGAAPRGSQQGGRLQSPACRASPAAAVHGNNTAQGPAPAASAPSSCLRLVGGAAPGAPAPGCPGGGRGAAPAPGGAVVVAAAWAGAPAMGGWVGAVGGEGEGRQARHMEDAGGRQPARQRPAVGCASPDSCRRPGGTSSRGPRPAASAAGHPPGAPGRAPAGPPGGAAGGGGGRSVGSSHGWAGLGRGHSSTGRAEAGASGGRLLQAGRQAGRQAHAPVPATLGLAAVAGDVAALAAVVAPAGGQPRG
jgi:translation initiation factor IF-2